jgi:hypothetical protein
VALVSRVDLIGPSAGARAGRFMGAWRVLARSRCPGWIEAGRTANKREGDGGPHRC